MWDEVPERTCPSCGRRERTRFDSCSACGTAYTAPAPPARGRRWGVVALAAVVLVAAGVGVGLLLDHGAQERERDRAERAAAVVAEKARLTRTQAPHRGAARRLRPADGATRSERLAARASLVREVERTITRDARARARAGELDGPISTTECGPLLKDPDAIADHRVLSREIGRYDCVAIRSDVRNETRSVARLGHAFVAAIDFRRFEYVWCRNTPPQGERGSALAQVRLQRACLAAKGRALGTGYVDVPGA